TGFYPEHRVYRARSSFLDLSDEQVLRRYRLDKAAIAGLCRELGADLESVTGRSHALPVAVKVTSALTFLASGSFQTATRDTTGISQSAMSNCLAQFLEALQRRAARYIAFPSPRRGSALPAAPFPGVLGLLGSMHVALRAPSENEPAFRNARNSHSMNMQVVCDAAGAITNVVAKFPGSCPNAAVLESSALARLLDATRPEGVWLLGVRLLELRPETHTVLVEAEVGAERVRELLESSGRHAVLRGMGGGPQGVETPGAEGGAAVAALSGGGVRGLVRFLQVNPERCVVDGVIDGLRPGPHGMHVHEFGDTSRGCE
ncbi:UNVERIFIED_CONTAM: hypothetical protein H355_003583, partial [Colinus virginianus]